MSLCLLPCVIMLSVVMLSVIVASVIRLSFIMLTVNVLSVVMQNVVLVGVVMMVCRYAERHYADCSSAVLLTFQLVFGVSTATMMYFMPCKGAIISYLRQNSQFVNYEWA